MCVVKKENKTERSSEKIDTSIWYVSGKERKLGEGDETVGFPPHPHPRKFVPLYRVY